MSKKKRVAAALVAGLLTCNAIPTNTLVAHATGTTPTAAPLAATGTFDKNDIRSIRVTNFKKDYWPNQYFVTGEYNNIAAPVTVVLTDGQGIEKTVSAHFWSTVTDPETQQTTTAWKYYGLEVYIPDDMKDYLTYEDVEQNGQIIQKIVLPSYDKNKMKIGVRLKNKPEIKGESSPDLYTTLAGLSSDGFSLNIYRADDPNKTPVHEILPNTKLNIDVGINKSKSVSFGKIIGLVAPGVADKIILHKVEDNGNVYYRNVSGPSAPNDYQPFTAVNPTLDSKLQNLPNAYHFVKIFFNKQDIKVLPPVIDRGSATDASINGGTGAYTRVVFDAADGTVTAAGTQKRVFDVLNTSTWGEAISAFGDLSVTVPSAKPVILGWTTPLPQNGDSLATLAGSGTDTTVSNGSIKTITYTQAYSVEVTDQRPDDEANWYHVTFKAGDHGQLAGQQTTEYWVHKKATTKTLHDLTAPHVTPDTDYFFTGWNQADSTQITGDLEVSGINKPVSVSADPNDSNSYAVVTFDTGQHGSLATGASSKLWVLKAANKTFADLVKPQVNASDGFEFIKFNSTNTGAITTDITATAEYRELDSHAHPAVIAPITVNRGDNLNPADFVSNKATDTTAGDKLPADVQFAFVTADGSPANPTSTASGTQDIYVKVSYQDGSSKIFATKLTVRTDAEKFVHDNGGNAFAGKGTVTVRKNKTVDLTQIAVNPALPQAARFESLGTVSTATPTTQPLNTTGEVVFPDGSKLSLPVEVTVIDLDPSVVPSIVSPHKDGNLWTTDKSFVVSVPQTNGAKTPGDLKVMIGNTEVSADQIKDNGDGTYTISIPQGLSATDAIQVTFTEPDKNPGVANASTPVVPVSESSAPEIAKPVVDKGATITAQDFIANKHGDPNAVNPLPADATYTFVDDQGNPTTAPHTTDSGNQTVRVKVTYADGSFDIIETTLSVRTDAEKFAHDNGGDNLTAKGTITVRKNKTIDHTQIVVSPELPQNASIASVVQVSTATPSATPVSTTARVVFADGSELAALPVEVTVIDLDPSVVPSIVSPHKDGNLWTTDTSIVVSVPKTQGTKTEGTLTVTIGGVEVSADQIKDNGDGTYTVSVPEGLKNRDVVVSFTEPDKNPGVVRATAPVVPASENNQPLLKAIELKKNAELTPESIVANGPNSAADPKLPAGTVFEFIDANDAPTKADTSTPGTHTVTLRVTYPDGSTDILTTTYTVLEPTSAEKYVERYTSAAGVLTIKRIENPEDKLAQIALVQTDDDFTGAHFTSIDTTGKDFTNPEKSPVATTGTLTFADGSELANVPVTVTVLELDPSVSPVISGVHNGDVWMRDAVFTVSIPAVNGAIPQGVLSVKVGGVDISAFDIVDNGDGTYTVHMPSDSAAVRPANGNIEVTFTEQDKNPTIITVSALDKQPNQVKVDPVKEEEQVLKVAIPSDGTDKIVVQLPDGTEVVLEEKDGQWPYMADSNGVDAGKLLIPVDMTPFTKGQIVKVIAFDNGVASEPVDLVIDARPVDPKPQTPVVDNIKAGDTSIKVQIPEDARFVEIVTKKGTLLITKNTAGVWVDAQGNPVEVRDGKLIVPVEGLKAGDKIIVRTINRDGVVSEAVVKTVSASKQRKLPRSGDTLAQGILFTTMSSGLSALVATFVRSRSKRNK